MSGLTLFLADEPATVAFGAKLAEVTGGRGVIFLEGNLGAGKTTLSRGLIRGLGHTGPVKSPTFTVVEPYEIGDIRAFHFDLYRLVDPEELEFMGIRDYFEGDPLCLFEWPDKGAGVLPKPDLTITISPQAGGRSLNLSPQGARGESWCAVLAEAFKQ
ncbi:MULTISPECIES: tRNA (adenosine(37)-N6)-threonylcarbamoyltransferase complex ATPase subunit type 1 TsaE [Pseudomonas]|uniref:tRNA (adenosine(37)-N6)-threonylcarbamoyltransferase complex ATPase subunit type 1 TsaE n=1 Tax=Pseudomonas TaxID=286 RepID=UPI001F00CA57|nr:tRNA (adenosine(37)-N6)-threonylcarbamoyltransferase complex ATPase subunit type 1 TsaE [Pseudomonas entomophila]